MRTGYTALTSLDDAARRKSAGRIVASRTAGARCARTARCGTAIGRLRASRARRRRWRRAKDAGPRRVARQRSVAGRESGKHAMFTNWARGTGIVGRRGAVQWCWPHLLQAARPERGAQSARVKRRAATVERRARCNTPRRRWQRASKTWGHGGRPDNEAFAGRLSTQTRASLDFMARRKSPGRMVANRNTGAMRERSARCGKARGRIGAPRAPRRRWRWPKNVGPRRAAGQRSVCGQRIRKTVDQTGRAARASLDVAARRKSVARIVAKRAMWHNARQA